MTALPLTTRIDSGVAIGNQLEVVQVERLEHLKVERPTHGVRGDRIVIFWGSCDYVTVMHVTVIQLLVTHW